MRVTHTLTTTMSVTNFIKFSTFIAQLVQVCSSLQHVNARNPLSDAMHWSHGAGELPQLIF